jgi:hypothetical protein
VRYETINNEADGCGEPAEGAGQAAPRFLRSRE